jgi:hypothetical protein
MGQLANGAHQLGINPERIQSPISRDLIDDFFQAHSNP